MHSVDALVIGAGAAGLAAAASLGEAGLRATVLEARERIGGRVHTLHLPEFPLPIELGAEFVHGSPEETTPLIEQAGLAVYEVADRHQRLVDGRLVHDDHFWDQMSRVLERLDASRPDTSFADFLMREADGADLAEARRIAARYVEGFHAADLSEVSARAVAEAESGSASGNSGMRRIVNGYAAVVGELHRAAAAAGAEVRLGHEVTAIRWARGTVNLETLDGHGGTSLFSAPRAVVTLPLPILQDAAAGRGELVIDPMPPAWRDALGGLRMGSVVRTSLQFRRRFWDADTSFVHHPESPWWQLWWTPAPIDAPLLTGWCGGPPARRLGSLEPGTILERAVEQLAELFDTPASLIAELLVRADTHDWSADRHSRGAYTYVAAGGAGSAERLAEPAEATLVIAGEAVAPPGRHGTVDGAVASGRRAVARLTGSL